MESKKQKNRIKNIILDIYYRLQALPMLFLLWLLLLVWKRRIGKWQMRLLNNRKRLNEIWDLSSRLEPDKYGKQQHQIKIFEKEFLYLEEDVKNDEERYEKQKELFEKYLSKVLDPNIGKKPNRFSATS